MSASPLLASSTGFVLLQLCVEVPLYVSSVKDLQTPFNWQAHDPRTSYFSVQISVALIFLVTSISFALASKTRRFMWLNWELIWVSMASFLLAASILGSGWVLTGLAGYDSTSDLQPVSAFGEPHTGLWASCLVLVFSHFSPVRCWISWLPLVIATACMSVAAALSEGGCKGADAMILAVFCMISFITNRRREQAVRCDFLQGTAWSRPGYRSQPTNMTGQTGPLMAIGSQEGSPAKSRRGARTSTILEGEVVPINYQPEEPDEKLMMTVIRLTQDLCVQDSGPAERRAFGREVEGMSFYDLVAEADRPFIRRCLDQQLVPNDALEVLLERGNGPRRAQIRILHTGLPSPCWLIVINLVPQGAGGSFVVGSVLSQGVGLLPVQEDADDNEINGGADPSNPASVNSNVESVTVNATHVNTVRVAPAVPVVLPGIVLTSNQEPAMDHVHSLTAPARDDIQNRTVSNLSALYPSASGHSFNAPDQTAIQRALQGPMGADMSPTVTEVVYQLTSNDSPRDNHPPEGLRVGVTSTLRHVISHQASLMVGPIESDVVSIPSSAAAMARRHGPHPISRQGSSLSSSSMSQSGHSSSSSLFCYSDSDAGSNQSSFSSSNVSSRGRRRRLIELAEAETQTEPRKLGLVDMGVETAIVWEKDGFRCKNCAKPPLMPGDLSRAPRDMQIGPRRSRSSSRSSSRERKREVAQQQALQRNKDPSLGLGAIPHRLNGTWLITGVHDNVCQWLTRFTVIDDLVFDANGRKFRLRSGERGEVSFAGGSLMLDADGTLRRLGKSGNVFCFVRKTSSNGTSEDPCNRMMTGSDTELQNIQRRVSSASSSERDDDACSLAALDDLDLAMLAVEQDEEAEEQGNGDNGVAEHGVVPAAPPAELPAKAGSGGHFLSLLDRSSSFLARLGSGRG